MEQWEMLVAEAMSKQPTTAPAAASHKVPGALLLRSLGQVLHKAFANAKPQSALAPAVKPGTSSPAKSAAPSSPTIKPPTLTATPVPPMLSMAVPIKPPASPTALNDAESAALAEMMGQFKVSGGEKLMSDDSKKAEGSAKEKTQESEKGMRCCPPL